ncbi:winged helix-turn-helix transcriptional regulator [Methanogenium organophilum]|uniref:Winged helix-turn-helix transcriptional regulator n=1 Tax=Methanogenium organophilum TaxID=2199 RepID=A0A9X9S4M1_METOG|nr:winged helix-turn-helix transcriptional regulator [Methanogenium organophilum]WAI01402.1 winged helix-turn-helix transcriptional regulator [Methanogenium organophilum]
MIIIIFLLFFVTIADATEYTITPSRNVGKPPGTSFDGEIVRELQPIPVWFAVLLTIFPQLAVINLESFIVFKSSVYICYVKIKQARSRSREKKEAIYDLIKMNPGMHFRELQRKTGLKKGTFEYHIKNMEHEGQVKAVQNNRKVHYFINNSTYSPEEMKIISVMNNESLKNILLEASTKPLITNKEIAENLELSKSSVSEKLNYLNDIGILNAKKEGWYTFYEISKEYDDAIPNYIANDMYTEQNRIVQKERISSL